MKSQRRIPSLVNITAGIRHPCQLATLTFENEVAAKLLHLLSLSTKTFQYE